MAAKAPGRRKRHRKDTKGVRMRPDPGLEVLVEDVIREQRLEELLLLASRSLAQFVLYFRRRGLRVRVSAEWPPDHSSEFIDMAWIATPSADGKSAGTLQVRFNPAAARVH